MRQQYKLDLYATLGLSSNATQDEIKQEYRKLAIKLHPDRNQGLPDKKGKSLQDRMCQINYAYSILSNPAKRRDYDLSSELGQAKNDGYYSHKDYLEELALSMGYSSWSDFESLDETRKKWELSMYQLGQDIFKWAIRAAILGVLAYGTYDSCSQTMPKQDPTTIQKHNQHENTGQLGNQGYKLR